MMVLHPSTTTETTSRTASTNPIMQQKSNLRRRRSKGTIVAYGNEMTPPTGGESGGPNSSSDLASSSSSIVPSPSGASQPQHSVKESSSTGGGSSSSTSATTKPCHSARLALLCVQNALRMGARTQLLLCPPGKVRRELQSALRQRVRMNSRITNTRQSLEAITTGYFGLEKLLGGSDRLSEYDSLEEDLLMSTSPNAAASSYYNDDDDNSVDKWASSGDEDNVLDLDDIFSEEAPPLDDEERYLILTEPLFAATPTESSGTGRTAMISMATGGSGKEQLPFNRRKIRFFDLITTSDSTIARNYLRKELQRSKKRSAWLLTRNLRKIQIEEKKRKRLEQGESIDDLLLNAEKEALEESTLFGGVQPFPHEMTPAMAAALILESLSLNAIESVEGMSKCYDGIVAAGVALLDAQAPETATLSPKPESAKQRIRRSEIMAALAPLLITSLEQPSGEVVLALAKLRRMCGTTRYQRRFVQRVAPCLIRPPRGAMWCLRHQNDMEAIVAASELIFDAAFDVFSKGWYERGRLLLADTKRAATLNSAAQQLRRLSSTSPMDGVVALGLPSSLGNRRRMITSAARKAEGGGAQGEALAEWEVMAVDRQIRISIANVLAMDWSRVAIHSDIPKPHNRRATVTSGVKHHRIATLPQVAAASTEMSPKAIASPRSAAKASGFKAPQSPPHAPPVSATSTSSAEGSDNVYNHQNIHNVGPLTITTVPSTERPSSPPPPLAMPSSPPAVQRTNSKEMEPKTPMTPPRSPKSPTRPPVSEALLRTTEPIPILAPISPKRGKSGPKEVVGFPAPPIQTLSTPLSPSASSIGTSGSGDLVSYKPSLVNSHVGATTTAHYRMLTSTAAERKRTVAACRALRAQIQRFEDAFIQLHGRPPKGAAERAPLATTYAQYREWKRAIRADAACRIQALFRGASVRWRLLRMNDTRITRIVVNRAGRARPSEAVMNQISIPVEIGQGDHGRSPAVSISSSPTTEAFAAAGEKFAPPWASKIARRRSGDREQLPAPPRYSPASHTPSLSDLASLSIAELQARKRDLKAQLKQYDMNFARKHGRMPVKAEKEPIRHLYESYNSLKSQISQMEQEGRQVSAAPATASQASHPAAPLSPVASSPLAAPQASQQRVSPTSGSESGHSGGEDSPLRINQLQTRSNKLKLPKAASPPLVGGTTASSPGQDLASLKAEKSQLHQMLRAYEKDFFAEHRRQVSSFADIKPVASQYRRYKDIKKAIAALQQGDSKG